MTRLSPLSQITQVLRDAGLVLEVVGPEDAVVSGVCHDSRQVSEGDLFMAWKGTRSDGHDYVAAAVQAGAVAALVERVVAGVQVPQVVVSDGRRAASLAADAFMGHPGAEVDVVAVTGTNGKTTTVNLVRHLLGERPGGAAAVGTLGITGPDGEVWPGTESLTTPDPVKLATSMRSLADDGVAVIAMEASSHALDQHRMDAVPVKVAVFTNFSRDHLDYHGSLDAYRRAKLRLAELISADGAAAVNALEPAWDEVRAPRRLTYAVQAPADVRAENVILRPSGTHFTLHYGSEDVSVALPLLGSFNAENAVAAAAVGILLGMTLEEIAERLETAPQIPGRMERIVTSPFTVIIDFAHTPDALETLLGTVKAVARGRLMVLFGAGGDRDRGKRRPMAEAVARHADRAYLTSDNPRTEDPEHILDDLAPGLTGVEVIRQVDRRAAIRQAVLDAEDGDVLVLAGKGHERYQVLGTTRVHLDEREEVQAALALRGAA